MSAGRKIGAMAEREIFGDWSRGADEAVEGRLLVDAAGQLDLQVKAALGEPDRIGGHLSDGSPATLFDANLLRRDPKEHFFEEHRIGTAILGVDLAGCDADRLVAAVERIEGLEQFVGTSGLSIEAPDAQALQRRSAAVAWKGADPIRVSLPGCELRLVDYTRFERESDFRYSLQHIAEARVETEEPVSLEFVDETYDTLAAFIAFGMEARVEPRSLFITADDGTRGEVLMKRRPQYGMAPDEVEPWLTLGDLSAPEETLAGFYRFAREQASAYLILFELLVFLGALNPIDKLLYLARFLEVFHRTRYPGERDPHEVHEKRAKIVREALYEDHKRWASQLLHHSNEVTFKERILRLLEGPAAAARPMIGGDVQDFARVVGDCRNYWTHYSPDLERKALRDGELEELDDRLLLMVRACVLDEIGVDRTEAEAAMRRDWRWERLAGVPLRIPRNRAGPT
jgi:hypothetical protein